MLKKDHELYKILKQLSELDTDLSMLAIECDKSSSAIPNIISELTRTKNWVGGSYNYFENYLKRNNIFRKHEKTLREYNHFKRNVEVSSSKAQRDAERIDLKKAKIRIISVKENLKRILEILSKFKD
jgi:hypothetical protein